MRAAPNRLFQSSESAHQVLDLLCALIEVTGKRPESLRLSRSLGKEVPYSAGDRAIVGGQVRSSLLAAL